MTDVDLHSAQRRRRWLIAGGGLLLVLVLVVAALVIRGKHEPFAPTASSPTAPATPPPYFPAPYSVTDRATLTVPEESRFARGTFWATAGETYLVTMDLESMKPEGSDGRSMYLGVTLSCSPRAGGPGISEGGTQNMLTGEVTQYRNQGLISVPEDGAVDCSIKLNAPYDDVASTGTTFTTDGTWRAEPVGGAARAFEGEGLPRTVAVGADESVMTVDLPLDSVAPGDLRALASVHLTACTGVNGSREEGRAWCSEGALDDAGSTVTTRLTAQLVDAGGDVCAELGTASTEPDHIDLYRHHRLLSLELTHSLPESPCGKTVRVSMSVHNDGPAPVVVHHANSSLVVL